VKEILNEVGREVSKAEKKHGSQFHLPISPGNQAGYAKFAERQKRWVDKATELELVTWQDIALEEVFETFGETEPAKVRAEALQAAAMFVQIVRKIDHDWHEANPLIVPQRVKDYEYGFGTIVKFDPEEFGGTAWIAWDRGGSAFGGDGKPRAMDLDWARNLERIDAAAEAL
jgi:hypothetical protein